VDLEPPICAARVTFLLLTALMARAVAKVSLWEETGRRPWEAAKRKGAPNSELGNQAGCSRYAGQQEASEGHAGTLSSTVLHKALRTDACSAKHSNYKCC